MNLKIFILSHYYMSYNNYIYIIKYIIIVIQNIYLYIRIKYIMNYI